MIITKHNLIEYLCPEQNQECIHCEERKAQHIKQDMLENLTNAMTNYKLKNIYKQTKEQRKYNKIKRSMKKDGSKPLIATSEYPSEK